MEITLTRSNAPRKGDRLVIFNIEGRTGSVQFLKTLFVKDAIPATLTLSGTFAAPKVKETPEERKARLKAMPKLTPAERVAKMEERLAKMKGKLVAAPAPAESVKVSEAPPAKTSGRIHESPARSAKVRR